jgi:hypothetical protein
MTIDTLDEMFEGVEDTSKESIIKSMMQDDEHLLMKTELPNPMAYTKLQLIAKWCRDNQLKKSTETISSFLSDYALNMVSNKRESRKETERMISAINAAQNQGEMIENRWFGEQVKK